MRNRKQITWHKAQNGGADESSFSCEGNLDNGDNIDLISIAHDGESGYVLTHAFQPNTLDDADDSGLDWKRVAGGNGEGKDWAMNLAPFVAQQWLDEGKPPIFEPDSDTPNAGDPRCGLSVIARIAHAANIAYCNVNPDPAVPTPPAWEDCTDSHKEAMVNGVNFVLANPYAGDAASHENWMRFKTADGWKYGEVKDENAKTHPCLVPFDKLPKAQQVKDALFRGVVLAFRAK